MNTELYNMAVSIRTMYRSGQISKEEAKEQIKPYEDFYNSKVVEIAKKYNRKPIKFSFASFMR